MTTTTTTKPLTWHRRSGDHGGRYARGTDRDFYVDRPYSAGNDSADWQLRIFNLRTVSGLTVADRLAHTTTAPTLSLAKRIAQEYEQLGEDYRSSGHGHRSRVTVATRRAYDAELAVMGWR